MSKDQLQTRDRVVQQLSREGLIEENVTKQTVQNISNVNNAYQMTETDAGSVEYDYSENKVYLTNEIDTYNNVSMSIPENQTFDNNGNQSDNTAVSYTSELQTVKSEITSKSCDSVFSPLEDEIDEGNKKLLQKNGQSKKENKKNLKYEKKNPLEDRANSESKLKESNLKTEKKLVEDKKKGLVFDCNEEGAKVNRRIKEKGSKDLKFLHEEKEYELSEDENSSTLEKGAKNEKNKKGRLDSKGVKRLVFEDNLEQEDPKEVFIISDKHRENFKTNGEIKKKSLNYSDKIERSTGLKKVRTTKKEISQTRLLDKNAVNHVGKGHVKDESEKKTGMIKQRGTKLIEGSRYQKPPAAVDIRKEYQKKINQQKAIESFQKIKKNEEFIIVAKKALIKIAVAVKSAATALFGFSSIFIFIICILLFAAIYLLQVVSTGAGAMAGGVYQSTYTDMSDCEGYFRELETALEERIGTIEEEYPGYYEYIYQLGEIEHNSVELMSYLATKYQDFTLETCKQELDSIFEERYRLFVEIKEEMREIDKRDDEGNIIYDEEGNPIKESISVQICYITLEVKPWDQIVEGRLSAAERERYEVYIMSRGAQQVYGNPLVENWSNKVTSNFGYRIHPITKEKSLHAGIDIAVPIGTPLYSCTAGVVTTSRYSDSAGNFIVVLMDSGYTVTYMHLDSLGVIPGEVVTKGMLIGATGNTGRSTGPHLHVEVRTEENKPIDPTFIISNGVKQQE